MVRGEGGLCGECGVCVVHALGVVCMCVACVVCVYDVACVQHGGAWHTPACSSQVRQALRSVSPGPAVTPRHPREEEAEVQRDRSLLHARTGVDGNAGWAVGGWRAHLGKEKVPV